MGKNAKTPDEVIKQYCEEYGLEFLYTKIDKTKGETMVHYICPKHRDKGELMVPFWHLRKKKHKCIYCAGHKRNTDDFKKIIENILPTVEIIGEYVKADLPIKCRCKIDNTVWESSPHSLIQGCGCPACGKIKAANSRRKSQEQFIKEVARVNENIEVIGEYKGDKNPVCCRCKIHDEIWNPIASGLIYKNANCPICTKEKLHRYKLLSDEEFIERVKNINSNITPLEKYDGYHNKIKFKCNIHNEIYLQSPSETLAGCNGCPHCVITKGEKKMNEILRGFDEKTIFQHKFDDCKYVDKLRFDAYSPTYNIAFEYNGIQHYEPVDFAGKGDEWAKEHFKLNQERDKAKHGYCSNNNIPLIIVPYWEFDDMEEYLHNQLKQYTT